jgi:DNA polymerase-4
LDSAIDNLRVRYGNTVVFRAVFVDGEIQGMTGGAGAEDYPVMSSILNEVLTLAQI